MFLLSLLVFIIEQEKKNIHKSTGKKKKKTTMHLFKSGCQFDSHTFPLLKKPGLKLLTEIKIL